MRKKLDLNDKLVGRPIKVNKFELEVRKGKDYAEMLFIGDCHLGSPQFDRPRFVRQLEYCLANRLYILLMGDLIECATRYSVGAGVYDQENPAQTQYEEIVDMLADVAKAGLVIGLLQGNHEERIYKESGVNISKAMARELDVPYLGDACWNVLRVGRELYTLYTLHGRTSARFDGTALLAAERASVSFNCDIFAMGHCHKLIHDVFIRERIIDGRVHEVKQYVVITGSYLKYHEGYPEKSGMQIAKLGSPKAKLFATKHDIFLSV